jgi:hypothetical protein
LSTAEICGAHETRTSLQRNRITPNHNTRGDSGYRQQR